ncbi:putative ATP-dependent RNA helicase DHR1 [Coelomomyces lativittatus]|nr:putative ATP-dependent RNA helicase DHR1 [Coelomomyces lativittatus]
MKTPSSSLSSLPSSSHLSPPTPLSTLTVPEITSKIPFHVQTLAGVETHPPALLSEKQVPLDSSTSTRRKLFVIPHRTETMQEQRMKLPVCQEEFRIMECIEEHPVVIICGETGSGKTTQVPQFLYEAGYGHPKSDYPKLIGVTQPRRVAAIAMSQRVGTELNAPELVSYQVRFEKNITASSKIHFMTDGVLLRELSQDLFLSNYSVIVLDEAHERNLNTDVLIGLLSRVVTHRSKLFQEWKLKSELAKKARQPIPPQLHFPLKLILMSATLRVSDFTDNQKLFPTSPPVIHIETRQFPVTLHFSRITPQDHVLEAFKKVCEIHAESPPGGILVFLTGQTEIYELIKKLKNKFQKKMKSSTSTSLPSRRRPPSSSSFSLDPLSSIEDQLLELDTGLLDFTHVEQPDEDGRINDEEQEESETEVMDFELSQRSSTHPHRQRNALGLVSSTQKKSTLARIPSDSEDLDEASTLLVLPLYSLLSSEEQMKVFDTVPEGTRLCVVATNVAETSLTIPGIRYVIDSGKCKTKVYDPITGAESFHKTWISKASADQRLGRAGRSGPGQCYRLYSSSVFDRFFPLHTAPEILTMPMESVILHLKAMHIDCIHHFPFPTSPKLEDIVKAEKVLQKLGAFNPHHSISSLGLQMSRFPVHPRFAKILLLAMQQELIVYAIVIVAILSVGDLFLSSEESSQRQEEMGTAVSSVTPVSSVPAAYETPTPSFLKMKEVIFKYAGHHGESDLLMMLALVGAYEQAKDKHQFCEFHQLRHKSFQNILALQHQLKGILMTVYPKRTACLTKKLTPPSPHQRVLIQQLMLAGFIDQVAFTHINPPTPFKRASKHAYQWTQTSDVLLIDRHSVLHPRPPEAVTFVQLHKGTTYTWMKGVTKIDPSWIGYFDTK